MIDIFLSWVRGVIEFSEAGFWGLVVEGEVEWVVARVVVRFNDLGEVALAFGAYESVLVPVPFVLALMAVYHVPLLRGPRCWPIGHVGWRLMRIEGEGEEDGACASVVVVALEQYDVVKGAQKRAIIGMAEMLWRRSQEVDLFITDR